MWISLQTFCSKVVVTFADHHGLLRFLTSSRSMKETVICGDKINYYYLNNTPIIIFYVESSHDSAAPVIYTDKI